MDGVAFRCLVALIFVAYMGHRIYYVRRVPHASESVVKQEPEPGGAIMLLLLFATVVILALYVIAPRRVNWASFSLPAPIRWAGLGLTLTAFALLEWSQSALGRNWSLRVQLLKEHELVVRGPYRWVRHPMYTAGLLTNVSVLLLSANWLVGGSWLLMHGWQFARRIPLEESLMVQQFGASYREYMLTTGRLLPRIHRVLRHRDQASGRN